MAKVVFGTNLSWAVKRWPLPSEWANIITSLDVHVLQFSFDLFDPRGSPEASEHMASLISEAVKEYGVSVHSTFTGLAAYSFNMLAHPDPILRADSLEWYTKALDFTSLLGVKAFGGHIAAMSVSDYRDQARRSVLERVLLDTVNSLRPYAARKGVEAILWEPMPVSREPPWTMAEAERFLKEANRGPGAAVKLNIDVGHTCTLSGREADPYEWVHRYAPESPAIHVQQTDGKADRHWPFTEEYNSRGIIRADRLLEAIDSSGAGEVYLFLEYIPAFELSDDKVLEELRQSVNYWRQYVH
ncbi:MAG: sugar phosphate isomerase/epimerase family protein [Acidilobus sp.]